MFVSRTKSDNYETSREGWAQICNYIGKDKVVWAPFFCSGKQGQIFRELGFNIIHEDKDFFSYEPEYDIIVCNPPFSIMKDVCRRLKELDKPFIIVARSNLILCSWFNNLFKEHLGVIIPNKRPHFNHVETPDKKYYPPFGTFYYCYKTDTAGRMVYI